MECLSHPDRGRAAQRSGVVVMSSSSSRSRWKTAGCRRRSSRPSPCRRSFTAAPTPTNSRPGHGGRLREHGGRDSPTTAAPITSVSELTPISSFGSDIVNIAAGPGGVFGDDVYAISRGARRQSPTPINRPGVIYRVDPATGQDQRLLRPEHGHQPDRPEHLDHDPRGQLAGHLRRGWSTGTA